jgi:hypothetical protein
MACRRLCQRFVPHLAVHPRMTRGRFAGITLILILLAIPAIKTILYMCLRLQ